MYILIISVILIVLSIATIVAKFNKSNLKIAIEYIFLVLGVIGFGVSVITIASKVNTLTKQNTMLIAYFVEHNCTDNKIEKSIKSRIIQYKVKKYSESLKNKN